MTVSLIVAKSENNVIGKDNQIPWRLSKDLKYFKKCTLNHTIIMGRKTYESIGKALPKRNNVVLSSTMAPQAGISVCRSMQEALGSCVMRKEKEVFIIGGAALYELALDFVDRLYITEVKAVIEGNVFFPEFDMSEWNELSRTSNTKDERNEYDFDFVVFER